MIETQWVVDFYYISDILDDIRTKLLKHDFGNNIENVSLTLIYEKESCFSMALTIRIKIKF